MAPSISFTALSAGASYQYATIFDNESVPAWWYQSQSYPPMDAKLLANGHLAWSLSSGGVPGGMEERTLSGQLVRTLNTALSVDGASVGYRTRRRSPAAVWPE